MRAFARVLDDLEGRDASVGPRLLEKYTTVLMRTHEMTEQLIAAARGDRSRRWAKPALLRGIAMIRRRSSSCPGAGRRGPCCTKHGHRQAARWGAASRTPCPASRTSCAGNLQDSVIAVTRCGVLERAGWVSISLEPANQPACFYQRMRALGTDEPELRRCPPILGSCEFPAPHDTLHGVMTTCSIFLAHRSGDLLQNSPESFAA